MTLQNIINGAQNVRKSRRAQIEYTRTQGGRVQSQRSGPFITTFDVTPGYPTHDELDAFVGQYQADLLGPYTVTFSDFTIRTRGGYDSAVDTVVVEGANQTGSTLTVDGFRANTNNLLLPGDVIQVSGVNFTYVVTNTVNSGAAGVAVINLDMPLASSPADGAAVTVGSNIQWRLFLEQAPDDLGLGSIPGFASFGNIFSLREGF